jgi:exodeoxyribonuclease-1
MWQYLIASFSKTMDQERMDRLPEGLNAATGSHAMGLMVAPVFGSEAGFMAPVLSLGRSIPYKNQTLWLRLDRPELSETITSAVDETTWVIRKKAGEPGIVLPPLDRYMKRMPEAHRQLASENINWLNSNPAVFQEMLRYHRHFRYPDVPDVDVDAALYLNGFPTPRDQGLCREFHRSDGPSRRTLVDSFDGAHLRELAGRVIIRNYPDLVSGTIADDAAAFAFRVNPDTSDTAMVDYRGKPRLTPRAALDDIAEMRAAGDMAGQKAALLDSLERYLREHFGIPPEASIEHP